MGTNFFAAIINSIKARFTALLTKFRMWTNPQYIRNRILGPIRQFFQRLFDVRPKHKNDYYELFGWLVSKKLAFAIVIVVGVFSLYFLMTSASGMMNTSRAGTKTYPYNSLLLRFAKGNVRITGRGGYLAYEGKVENGAVNGGGILYDRQGARVYQGNFASNEYSGSGTLFYPNGNRKYSGSFERNVFEGSGKLFRENGVILYDGEFSGGLMEGTGKLYDQGAKAIYTGTFSSNNILYSELLNKKTEEIAEMYTGSKVLYEDGYEFIVLMPDIDALYVGDEETDALEEGTKARGLYVLKDSFQVGKTTCKTVDELVSVLGNPIYEGNSRVILPQAVSINYLNSMNSGEILHGYVELDTTEQLKDYYHVDDMNDNYEVYLYSFETDEVVYTFVCRNRGEGFAFYILEAAE